MEVGKQVSWEGPGVTVSTEHKSVEPSITNGVLRESLIFLLCGPVKRGWKEWSLRFEETKRT